METVTPVHSNHQSAPTQSHRALNVSLDLLPSQLKGFDVGWLEVLRLSAYSLCKRVRVGAYMLYTSKRSAPEAWTFRDRKAEFCIASGQERSVRLPPARHWLHYRENSEQTTFQNALSVPRCKILRATC